jgi:16S rRNA processing protein RimM
MGRVAGAYGVRGWLKVAPERGAAEGLVAVGEWWIGAAPYEVSGARLHGAAVLCKPSGIDTREQAAALKGQAVAVRREDLPQPGEGRYYLADLVGLAVLNEQGEALGEVQRVFSNGAQDVIEVRGKRTRLIPWVAAVVKEVNLAEKQVRVEWGADW